MSSSPNPADTKSDRIKLPFTFDVDKMKEEIAELNYNSFSQYSVMTLRGPAHIIDPSLPPPPPVDDYADGSWTDWLDSKELQASPYLLSMVDTFRAHTKVILTRLLRLAPFGVLKEHTDPTLGLQIPKSVIRLTIPIETNDETTFYLNGEPVPMQPGECWYMRLTDPHRVVNDGSTDRINMSIDMIPNDWVRSMIMESEQAT